MRLPEWCSKRSLRGLSVLSVLLGTALAAGIPWPRRAAGDAPEEQVARGRYLSRTLGCGDCHTPHDRQGRPIAERAFSGHPEGAPLPEWDPSLLKRNIVTTTGPTLTAWAGPFGLSVAGNLTPDVETGIGKLTAEELLKSWRTGKHWKFENRPVLPPMPMAAYGELSEPDIRALHAYLMTLKPIRNQCPRSQPAPPPDKG
jgi:cytochrome c553